MSRQLESEYILPLGGEGRDGRKSHESVGREEAVKSNYSAKQSYLGQVDRVWERTEIGHSDTPVMMRTFQCAVKARADAEQLPRRGSCHRGEGAGM